MNHSVRNAIALCALLGVAIGATSAASAQNAPAPTPDSTAPPAADAAPAAPAKAMAKPHRKIARPMAKKPAIVLVTVSNMRAVALTGLDAAPTGGAESARILGALAPGKKAVAKVAHGKDCTFDLHGAYEDGSTTDVPGVDLCKEKKLNLVE